MALSINKLQIIILGDGAVGKTSILKMYAEGKYNPSHITTIGKYSLDTYITFIYHYPYSITFSTVLNYSEFE
jgi:GTPase SAR1 family protein